MWAATTMKKPITIRLPIAISVSDLHLSVKPPTARNETQAQWFDTMRRALRELGEVARVAGLPIICGGDIFDRWCPPPELVNFALDNLPTMYAVPGQHDLPYHNYELMDRCGYGVLVRAKVVVDLPPGIPVAIGWGQCLYGFPWGHPPQPRTKREGELAIAVCHHYVWTADHGYTGAEAGDKVTVMAKQLQGYGVAVFGDNHKGFTLSSKNRVSIVNNGGFIRRRSDEAEYVPSYNVIYSDGTAERVALKAGDGDELKQTTTSTETDFDAGELVAALRNNVLGEFDYVRELQRTMKEAKTPKPVQSIIKAAATNKTQ